MTTNPLGTLVIIGLLLLAMVHSSQEQVSYARMRKLMETSYDRRRPPLNTGGLTLNVGLGAHIREIALDESRLSMIVHMDLMLNWTDERLRPVTHDTTDLVLSNGDVTALVWTPALYVRNGRGGGQAQETRTTLVVSQNGIVFYQQRIMTEVSCSNFTGDLRPLVCSLYLQMEGSADSDVTLVWEAVTVEERLRVPRYTLTGVGTLDCTEATSVGSYACRQLSLAFRQDVDLFSTEVYGASFLLVLLSWIGFWVDGAWTSVRLALGLGVLLPLVVYSVGFRIVHYKVGLPGGVEVWVAFCVAFVLASLVEFAFVHALLRGGTSTRVLDICHAGRTRDQSSAVQPEFPPGEASNLLKAAKCIDVASGIAFPIMFVVFNFIYWSMY